MMNRLLDNIGNLQDYIRTLSQIPPSLLHQHKNLNPFITISRQSGAGGRTLAEMLSARFAAFESDALFHDWQILDREICRRILEDPKLKISEKSILHESFKTGMEDYLTEIIVGTSPQIAIFHKVAEIILSCARVGKVIVVGRAGSLITHGLPLGIHVRLIADKLERVQRIMRRDSLSRSEADRLVTENDQSRAMLVRAYFSRKDIDDPMLYDMVFNTGTVPISEVASVIMRMVKDKVKNHPALQADWQGRKIA